jgi:hypothetical protein
VGNNVALADVDGNVGEPARFVATAAFPGLVETTRVSGELLTTEQTPIPGARVRVVQAGTELPLEAMTDGEGQFAVREVAPGLVTIQVDAQTIDGVAFPSIRFELLALAGRENRLPRPILLPPLDAAGTLAVDETTGGTLTLPGLAGLAVEVAPGSVTFPDGTRAGTLQVAQVNRTRVPMAPPGGMAMPFALTLQPSGTRFDPPARVTLPNVDATPPGSVVDLVTYDHALGRFVVVGQARVAEDGARVVSEPGQGLVVAGWWGGPPPPPPTTTGDGDEECDDASPIMDFLEEMAGNATGILSQNAAAILHIIMNLSLSPSCALMKSTQDVVDVCGQMPCSRDCGFQYVSWCMEMAAAVPGLPQALVQTQCTNIASQSLGPNGLCQ